MEKAEKGRRSAFSTDGLLTGFCKIIAIIFIGFALIRWMQVIGMMNPGLRFDTMSTSMRWGTTYLAIVQPVAALGLWSNLTWGYVVWALAAVGEVMLHFTFPNDFGALDTILVFHATCAAAFMIAFILGLLEQQRRENS